MQFICYLKRDFSRLLINRSPSCSQFRSLCLFFRRIFTIDGKLFIHLISIAMSAKNTVTLPRKIFSRKTGGAGNLRWLRLIYDRHDVTLPTSPLLLQQSRPETWKTGHWRAERDQPSGSSVQGYSRIPIQALNPYGYWSQSCTNNIGYFA